MQRLTFDLVLAGLLAAAPLALAQQPGVPGAIENRNHVTPSGPRPTPSTTTRNTPPFPGDEPLPPQRVPPDVPPVGTPTPSPTTVPERAANEPIDAAPPMAGRPEAANGDVRLLQKVQELNEKELTIARLAADKARSPRVKSYAGTLVKHHKAVQRQLSSYVNKRGLTRQLQAAATQAPGATEADMHARLLGETGAEFDQDFVATMVDDHDRAIALVRTARDTSVDPQLRDLFDGLLAKLENHRKVAQQLLEHLAT